MAMWLPSKTDGSGQFHIICPMEKYIKISKNATELISRRNNFGVWVSFSVSAAGCGQRRPFVLSRRRNRPFPQRR